MFTSLKPRVIPLEKKLLHNTFTKDFLCIRKIDVVARQIYRTYIL